MPTIFIVVPAALIIIIIFCIIYRKQIRLKLLQLAHGKYSFEFVAQFKKYTNKSPFPYCFKDDILPYLRLINAKNKEIFTIESEIPCEFEDSNFGEIKELILKDRSHPDCFNIFRIEDAELRAYGYEENRYDAEYKTVFFFMHGMLAMGEYIFESSSKVDISKILGTYISTEGLEKVKSQSKFLISCANNTTILYYDNGFTTIIRFVDLNNKSLMKIING